MLPQIVACALVVLIFVGVYGFAWAMCKAVKRGDEQAAREHAEWLEKRGDGK